jgi:dTDP-4-amino-4,6-dideoxygalactose transaminase
MIKISQPSIGESERRAVLDVLDSGQLVNGPVTRRFEAEFATQVSRTREAVAVASGTAALHLALLAHDIGPGHEVIAPAFSFQATASMVLAVGARPMFVDVQPDGNIDPSLVEAAWTPRTRAVLPVYLFGRVCDMTSICDIAAHHGLVIIEDAAQAHAAELHGRRAGSFGTGCFSLYATKNLTAAEGGVITTDDPDLAARLRRLRNHGEGERYDSAELGYNYRLTEMGAALALAQLPRLPDLTLARRNNAAFLSCHLRGVTLPPVPGRPEQHVWHQYAIRVDNGRDELRDYLAQQGIQSSVHYPKPLPAQKLYRKLGYDDSTFPVARALSQQLLSLPVHPGLSENDLERIVTAVNSWTHSRGGRQATS